MTVDRELLENYKARLADRYTAPELAEMLNLDVWDVLDAFEEQVMNLEEE